jgi:hypothetical protein
MIEKVKHAPHPISKIIPPMTDTEKKELAEDIKKNGLLEPVVLLDDMVLDGVSRQEACLRAGIASRYIRFDQLLPATQAAGPVAFVISRNAKRRHLTASQKAAIAVDALPFFEAEAAARRSHEKPKAPEGADGSKTEQPATTPGKAAAKAAATTGASTRSVERAKAIKKKSPKKFAAIKAGKTTLAAASRDKKKEAAAAKAVKTAAQGLTSDHAINRLLSRAEKAGGKLAVVIEGFKIVVAKVKARGRPKKKAA